MSTRFHKQNFFTQHSIIYIGSICKQYYPLSFMIDAQRFAWLSSRHYIITANTFSYCIADFYLPSLNEKKRKIIVSFMIVSYELLKSSPFLLTLSNFVTEPWCGGSGYILLQVSVCKYNNFWYTSFEELKSYMKYIAWNLHRSILQ